MRLIHKSYWLCLLISVLLPATLAFAVAETTVCWFLDGVKLNCGIANQNQSVMHVFRIETVTIDPATGNETRVNQDVNFTSKVTPPPVIPPVIPPPATYSFFTSPSSPPTQRVNDVAKTVGIRFRSDRIGTITAIKFYVHSPGAYPFGMWTDTGTLLSKAQTFSATTAGWKTVTLTAPVAMSAGALYRVGVFYAPNTGYSKTIGQFGTVGLKVGPIEIIRNGGAFNGNTILNFPGATGPDNFWIDVVFKPS